MWPLIASLGGYEGGSLPYDRVMSSTDPGVADLLARMPKAELHLHLDGSVRPATALELARQRGLDEGMDLAAMAARLRDRASVLVLAKHRTL